MKIKQQLQCELAKREFWYYCKLIASDFYKDDRTYLKEICDTLQDFYESDKQVLCINLPPRHGKSRTATLFVEWCLGKDNSLKVMTGSYNETLSTTFSKQVRDSIQEIKADEDRIIYSDIFPSTKIKYGDSAVNLWSLEGNNNKNYLATSPTGTATGFGADILVIDDVLKNAEDANNANVLEKHWNWFTNTMLSRLQGKRKVIIIMTRWATNDLAGKAIRHFKEIGQEVELLSMKAFDGTKMLCDDVLSLEEYKTLEKTLGSDILNANYNQKPIDLKGVLYSNLNTYDSIEAIEIKSINNYTDTADTGKDYLCSITYAVDKDKNAYILDVIYTQEPMEITEPLLARTLLELNVNYSDIESNNGGRGFARNVQRITKGLGNRHTIVRPFTQTKNKESRIITNATGVMNSIYFPYDWKYRFPDFYKDVTTYQRTGKNLHDDAEDSLTGVYEKMQSNNIMRTNARL